MKKVFVTFVIFAAVITSYMLNTLQANTQSTATISELSIGDEHLDGIIFYLYTDEDGKQGGLVVSKTETAAAWQDPPGEAGATGTVGGPDNFKLITDSPAKDWITENFSEEWYLPTIDELTIIWFQRYTINDALEEAGDYPLLSLTGQYWSSREYGERNAYFYNFEDGDPYTDNKSFKYSVRAIRAF